MRLIQYISGAFIGFVILLGLTTTNIAPDEIGVRRSVTSGVEAEDLLQGRHLDLPFFHTMYRQPSTIQYLEFAGPRVLDLRTKENNVIHLDVLIPYQIIPGHAHSIVSEGYATAYHTKVTSVSEGFLREYLAQFTNMAVQLPSERERVARGATKELDKRLRQYHVRLHGNIVLRAIYFDDPYEQQLQAKQLYAVQAMLDAAIQDSSKAKQETDTVEKGIDKDVAVENENWNNKIALANKQFVEDITKVQAEAIIYDRTERSKADGSREMDLASGDKALDFASATGKRLESEALASKAGRTYSAIEAAKVFKLGKFTLNSSDPHFLTEFASMGSWRKFFGAE